jgi:hypothetical protein
MLACESNDAPNSVAVAPRALGVEDLEHVRRFLVDEAAAIYGAPGRQPLPGQNWLLALWSDALGAWTLSHSADTDDEGEGLEVAALCVVHGADDVNRVCWLTVVARRGTASPLALDAVLDTVTRRWPFRKVYLPAIGDESCVARHFAKRGVDPELTFVDYVWDDGRYQDLLIYSYWSPFSAESRSA